MFSEIKDYGAVFETLVTKTADYLIQNNIKAQILGISGGIDSTVVAAICREVSNRTGIPLIGRSLPSKFNKEGETTAADLVGKAFCTDYKVFNIEELYTSFLIKILHKEVGYVDYDYNIAKGCYEINNEETLKFQTPIANGNIQARLRMIYLYNLASIHKGLVMDTDNLTENNLGYFTIHGDVGDFNPIGGLWKTEVFKLAEWLANNKYKLSYSPREVTTTIDSPESAVKIHSRQEAILESLKLKPTAGLGITDSDLDEIGAESYDQVDRVLQFLTDITISSDSVKDIPEEIFDAIVKRHHSSGFKRKQLPIKIERDGILV